MAKGTRGRHSDTRVQNPGPSGGSQYPVGGGIMAFETLKVGLSSWI